MILEQGVNLDAQHGARQCLPLRHSLPSTTMHFS
jgi:hypothetical protein